MSKRSGGVDVETGRFYRDAAGAAEMFGTVTGGIVTIPNRAGFPVPAHRLVWRTANPDVSEGVFHSRYIAHVNGNTLDNSIANLELGEESRSSGEQRPSHADVKSFMRAAAVLTSASSPPAAADDGAEGARAHRAAPPEEPPLQAAAAPAGARERLGSAPMSTKHLQRLRFCALAGIYVSLETGRFFR